METPDPWPLWRLELRTPRLTLRPDDDEGLAELMAEACRGVHDPAEMPFTTPWTDSEPADLVREGMQYHWSSRVECTPDHWRLNFLIRYEGKVIGCQSLSGRKFAVTRNVGTGSWIGRRFQGNGIGTEMRAAVLLLAFDHLGARSARSEAFADNPRSHGVSRTLGYEPDGTETVSRRGEPAVNVRLLVRAANFVRPDWKLEVDGLPAVLPVLGL
jgi:RimJ/RimL family protein N-acetyltransferase